MPKAFILAYRNLYRDWRNPELRVLIFALMIAVAAVTAVSFFTDRIQRLITQQAAEFLGADLKITSYKPLPQSFTQKAQQLDLKTADILYFPSVVMHEAETALTSVKAVSTHYPLRGELRIADQLFAPEQVARTIPQSGHVWVEARLLSQLKLELGEQFSLGEKTLTVEKILTYESDRSGWLFQWAPRVLMNLEDVAQTGLIQVGSRVNYQLLVAGAEPEMSRYRQWLTTQLQPDQKMRGIEDARPELRQALERAERFLGLAALIAVILAGAAIAVAAQHFSQTQAHISALLRCFGGRQRLIIQIYLLRLLSLGILASGLGCGFGGLAQQGLAYLLAHYFAQTALPSASAMPLLIGFATGLITLFGFALPPVMRIGTVPPLRVFRQELGPMPLAVWQVVAVAVVAMALLITWQAGSITLAALMLGGSLLTLLTLMAVAYVLIRSLRGLQPYVSSSWRFGLANLARRLRASSLQLTAFGLAIMVLLLLTIVRVDLLKTWQNNIPPGTPNHFLINIPPNAVAELKQQFEQNNFNSSGFYPMIVGRFVAINEQPLSADDYSSDRAKRLIDRTFNLSSAQTLPDNNRIIAGTYWTEAPEQPRQLSVEKGFAEEIGIQLGDSLQFIIAGQALTGQVTSLRAVQWDSFQVNFFVLASADMIQDLPATYVTSFYLPPAQTEFIPQLLRLFPSVTVIDVATLIAQVRTIMERATLAVQYVFMFTLLASLMVLYAALSASHETRLYEGAILRALGATRTQLIKGLMAEFTTLGLLAGSLAALIATILAYILSVAIFEFPYQFNIWIWFVGMFVGVVGIGVAGLLGTRSIWQRPPSDILRRHDYEF